MALLRNRDQVLKFLNDTFSDDFSNWKCIERHIWRFNAADGTGTYAHEQGADFSFQGQIGINVNARAYRDGNLGTLVAEFTRNNRNDTMTHRVYKEGNTYRLVTFWTFLYDSFLLNMNKMRGNASYIKAVEMSGKPNPTDEEIATVMATITYDSESTLKDEKEKEIKLDVTITPAIGRVKISGQFTVDGVPSNAVWRWFIDPLQKIDGLDSHPRAGGEYVGQREFDISSDFRQRDAFTIMRSDEVLVRCFCQYHEEDGTSKQVVYEQVHNFSEHLPVYDYFGLR